jgi:hypothetical protein
VNRLIEKRILERKLKVEKHQMEIQRFDERRGCSQIAISICCCRTRSLVRGDSITPVDYS